MATMNQMEQLTRRAWRTRTNIMFLSPPARGKTAMGEQISAKMQAEDPNFQVIDFDCGTLSPTDTTMSMPDMVEKCIVTLRDRRLPNWHKTPDARGIINLHEWMLMGLEVNRGFQKLINHEELGGFRIPPGFIFRADGNRLQDRAGAQQQSRAIMSRFDVFELSYDQDYALDVAKAHFHERVAAFLIRTPSMADNYGDVFENDKREANDITLQEGKRGAWASLRSWSKVSTKMRDADATGIRLLPEEVAVCTGAGVAATFDVFCNMLDNLASLEDIIDKPTQALVPERMDQSYALSTMLALTVNRESFKPVSVYMNRMKVELQAAFFRLMNDRLVKAKDGNDSAIRSSKEYKSWITAPHISKILLGASQ